MKFCQIEIVKGINSVNDSIKRNEIKAEIAKEYNISIDELNRWIADGSNSVSSDPRRSILGFFESSKGKNNKAYNRIKRKCRNLIIDSLFNSRTPAVDNRELNSKLQSLISAKMNFRNYSEQYKGIKDAIEIYKMGDNAFKEENDQFIIDYLLINHMDLIVGAWLNELISYDNGVYSYDPEYKIRDDWNSEDFDSKEPDVNALIKVMLDQVNVGKFKDGKLTSIGTSSIEKQSFLSIATWFMNTLSNEDYAKCVENPYYILEVIKKRFVGATTHSLNENVLASFANKFLFDLSSGEEKQFLKSFKDFSFRSTGFSPLDIFINAFTKYMPLRYWDQNVNGETLSIGGNNNDELIGEVYNKICRNIETTVNQKVVDDISSAIKSKSSYVKKLINRFFPFDIEISKRNEAKIFAFLQSVVNWYNSENNKDVKDKIKFADWIKSNSDKYGVETYSKNLRNIIDEETITNPNIISGSQKNITEKMLPTTGVVTVAGNIKLSVFKNEENRKRLGFTYPSVYSQGFLYSDITTERKDDLEMPIFNGTKYFSTLFIEGLEAKEFTNLSFQEQFKLSFLSNFYKGWSSNSEILIEAITPSDKKRIPWFSFNAGKLKEKFGNNWKTMEPKIINEMQAIHAQYLLNSINDFNRVLGRDTIDPNTISNAKLEKEGLSRIIPNLLEEAKKIQDIIKNETEQSLNKKINDFNLRTGSNILLSKGTDYTTNKDRSLNINPFLLKSLNQWSDPQKYLYSRFAHDLQDISNDIKELNIGTKVIDFSKINNSKDLRSDFSELYEFFLISIICSENILINTVGLPYSHKHGKPGDDFDSMDTSSHVTMVKRMAAMTATSHPMMKGVLTGQPDQIKTLSWYNDKSTMVALSGKSTNGNTAQDELELNDGLMISTRISDNLTKQSIGDVKPEGNAIKYLIHDFRPDKCASRFTKMASNSIDNAYIRSFGFSKSKINPKDFIMLQLSGIQINEDISVDEDGSIVDYDGYSIFDDVYYYKKNGVIFKVSDIWFEEGDIKYTLSILDDPDSENTFTCKNDLYDIWNEILGGEWSCDINGNYNESSMDLMTDVVNKLGKSNTENVSNQSHVDQYAKKQMIMYFPSDSSEKSMHPMTVDLKNTINSVKYLRNGIEIEDLRYTTLTDIDYFGIQLDPNHEAVNSKIHEITQMMSYFAEKGLVQEKTGKIYKRLVDLINVLSNQTFIDKSSLMDSSAREIYKSNIDNIFGKKILRVFADPSLDVISLSNEICREINNLNIDLLPPYSDHQFLMKLHTTVGSYFNKFIAREWTGRGDVLMGSSGLAMILEDEDGVKYLANGEKNGVNIQYYLDSLYHNEVNGQFDYSYINPEAINRFRISVNELEPSQTYYVVNSTGHHVITIDTHSIMSAIDRLMKFGFNDVDFNYLKEKTGIEFTEDTIFVKALNIPRDLKTKNIVISDGTNKVNIWHFKTHMSMITASIEGDKKLYEELQVRFNKILESLSRFKDKNATEKDLILLGEETGLVLSNILDDNFIIYHDEKLSTNPYGDLYGDNEMVMSEIHQRKSDWFLENLKLRCPQINESRPVFYSSNGSSMVLVDKDDNFNRELYTKVIPVLDDDGYLIDKTKGFRFKLPKNAEVYSGTVDGVKVTYIVADKKDIDVIANSKSFVYYRYSKDLGIKNIKWVQSDEDLKTIAEAQYKDWLDGNLNMVSRIPAQALSFGMIMETVGYLPWKNNVSMVNNMHVYMEGSDYDIDKIFMMFKAFSNSGLQVNQPYYRIYTTDTSISDMDLESSIRFNELIANNIISELRGEESVDIVSEGVKLLEHSNIYINVDDIINLVAATEGLMTEKISKRQVINIINDIKRSISLNDAITSLANGNILGLQNLILDDIKTIYDDPKTLVAATTPTTMAPVNDVVKAHGFEKLPRYHHSITTNIRVNRTTAVGKAGVGITANGQKAAYAVEYYNSVLYGSNRSLVSKPYMLSLPETMKINGKDWGYLMHPGAKINDVTFDNLVNLVISNGKYTETLGRSGHTWSYGQYNLFAYKQDSVWFLENNGKRMLKGQPLDNFYPTDIISAMISSCTDNAKEMKIDLINGTEETLSGYIYCILIGMDIHKAFNIFGRPIVSKLINESRGDLYKGEERNKILKVVEKVLKENDFINFINKYDLINIYSAELGYEEDKIIEILKSELTVLKKVFQGAQAVTSLSKILGINGGIEVNFGAPTVYRYNVNESIGYNVRNFDIYDFIFNGSSNDYYIDAFDKSNEESRIFNILRIIETVPHYKEMIKVPLQFENNMRLISKDYDNVVNIADKLSKLGYKISSDLELRKIARYINDRKIHDFFIKLGFEYIVDTGDVVKSLNTNTTEGLTSLKQYIEKYVFNKIKDLENDPRYVDNIFISQLSINTRTMPLFGEEINYIGLFTNINNPDNLDKTILIKDAFYQIQNEEIDGITVFDWLFLYDLLVNKHTVGSNNITQIFDNKINLDNPSSLVRKWIEFINEYDRMNTLYEDINTDITKLGIKRKKEDDDYPDDGIYIDISKRSYDKALYQDPNKFPLYINKKILGLDSLFNIADVYRAFKSGKIILKRC